MTFLKKYDTREGEIKIHWFSGGLIEMAILQGSSYKLPIVIEDVNGEAIDESLIERAVFTFGEIKKEFGDGGEVYYDWDLGAWIMPLSEEETFALQRSVMWQARFLFKSGKVDGTVPKEEYVYESINHDILGGEVDA